MTIEATLLIEKRSANWRTSCRNPGMFAAAKDSITSSVARKFLNSRFERYGEIKSLRLDSRQRRGEVVCAMRGEAVPVRVVVDRYTVRSENGKTFVRIDAVSCDRTWLENLIHDHAASRWFELPGWAAAGL